MWKIRKRIIELELFRKNIANCCENMECNLTRVTFGIERLNCLSRAFSARLYSIQNLGRCPRLQLKRAVGASDLALGESSAKALNNSSLGNAPGLEISES